VAVKFLIFSEDIQCGVLPIHEVNCRWLLETTVSPSGQSRVNNSGHNTSFYIFPVTLRSTCILQL